jgi:hypothetical protein
MVPRSWVRHLAHETAHEVRATGNQALREEADIPGTSEALSRVDRSHLDGWEHSLPPTFVEQVRTGDFESGLSDALLAE